MSARRAILFSQMQPPPERSVDFNTWYDTDHIPARMVLPGFISARRLAAVEGYPKYLVVYELENLAALESAAYLELKRAPSAATTEMLPVVEGFTRFTCVEVTDGGADAVGPYVAVSAFAIPAGEKDQFEQWYAQECIDQLPRTPDWLSVRLFTVIDGEGGPWTHLALHQMASADAAPDDCRPAAGTDPRHGLAQASWFRSTGQWRYEAIRPTVLASGARSTTLSTTAAGPAAPDRAEGRHE